MKDKSAGNDRILIFAKAPVPGLVKTRLAPAMDSFQAARLQAKLIDKTLATAISLTDYTTELWCTPDTTHYVFREHSNKYGIQLKLQQGDDLGERMMHAAHLTLQLVRNIVIIGTDCPDITRNYIQSAFDCLNQGCDVVLGPAEDGGYVLLGLNRIHTNLFKRISWGTNRVLDLTRERLRDLHWCWEELATLQDIDRPEDLVHYSDFVNKLEA